MKANNIVTRIQQHQQKWPNKIAVGHIHPDETLQSITYKSLFEKIVACTEVLKAYEITGKPVVLSYKNGYEFIVPFLACMALGALPIPYPLIQYGKKGFKRFQRLIDFIQPSILLTDEALSQTQTAASLNVPIVAVHTSALELNGPFSSQHDLYFSESHSSDVAYLQFTSGSTSLPKGVEVTFDNIDSHMAQMNEFCKTSDSSVFVTWLPYYHDLGLVGQWLHALYYGASCYSITPVNFIQNPMLWLKSLSQYKATITFSPNFAFEWCVRKYKPEELENLSLSSLDVALNGAETVYEDTLEKFARTFEPYGFRPTAMTPAYGLAEATLVVSAKQKDSAPKVKHVLKSALAKGQCQFASESSTETISYVSCGMVLGNQTLRIVDPGGQCLEENHIGQICLMGPSVTKGYWKQAEETNQTFKYQSQDGQGPLMCTGDLGFMSENELFITGRLKDVIIVRGENYYPNDIEYIVGTVHSGLRHSGGCAFALSESGLDLVIIHEVERTYLKKMDFNQVAAAIQNAIYEEFQLAVKDVVFIRPMTLPKTTSGKVQRLHCKHLYLDGQLDTLFQLSSNHANDNQHQDMLQWIRIDLEKVHQASLADQRRGFSPGLMSSLQQKGLLGIEVPALFGGLGYSTSQANEIYAAIAEHDLSLSLFAILNNTLATYAILKYAKRGIKESLLKEISSGQALVAFALTEKGAGSNPQAIQSKAVQTEDGWEISGEKIWSGSALWAKYMTVFARCFDKHQNFIGYGCFWIENHVDGIEHFDEAQTMGLKGMIQNSFRMTNVKVKDENLIGTPTQGLTIAYEAMGQTRMSIGAGCIGGLRQCLRYLKAFVPERIINTGYMLANDYVRYEIGKIQDKIDLLDSYVGTVAKQIDNGQTVSQATLACIKYLSTTFLWDSIDSTMQLLGGRSYLEDNRLAQLMRDARVFRVFEGPSEALLYYIGSEYAKRNSQKGDPAQGADQSRVDEWLPIAKQVESSKHRDIGYITLGELLCYSWIEAHARDKQLAVPHWLERHIEYLSQKVCSDYPAPSQEEIKQIFEHYDAISLTPDSSNQPSTTQAPALSLAQTSCHTAKTIQSWIQSYHPSINLTDNLTFAQIGIDSIMSIELAEKISEKFGVDCKPAVFWQFKTIIDLASWLDASKPTSVAAKSVREQLLEKLT